MKQNRAVIMSIPRQTRSTGAHSAADDRAAFESKPNLSVMPSLDAIQKELREAQNRLQLFKNVAGEMNSGMPVQGIIEHTFAETQKIFPSLRISYWTSITAGRAKVELSVGCASMPATTGLEVDLTAAAEFLRELAQGRLVAIEDVFLDTRTMALREILSQSGTRAILVIPIQNAHRELAFVSYAAAEVREWTDYETAILSDMAEYLAVAIRQAQAEQESKKMEEHLRESQKAEAVGRLVGGIAHDFNNLLTAMMIYCGLLSSALGKAHRLHGHVDEIRQAGERGASLVAQLLALTKQQVLEPQLIAISSVVAGIRDMLQRMIGEDIVLLTNSAVDIKSTKVDPAQLEQVILNMVINARDAMPSGGRLIIECANVFLDSRKAHAEGQELPPGEYVELRVSDTGHGMDAETKAHIFEPFFTTKERGKGTGLGLATAYGIVHQHGGSISVDTEPGKGASFRILLPVVEGEDKTAESSFASESIEEQPRTAETLLLVEDEDLVRRSLVEILRMTGYHVLEAAGGSQALEISDGYDGDIQLMITDLIMPGMNGRQVADRMAERRPQTAVLFMSGYSDDPRTRKMLGEGVDFFRKPFSPRALTDKIRELLDRSKQQSKVAMFPGKGEELPARFFPKTSQIEQDREADLPKAAGAGACGRTVATKSILQQEGKKPE
jgi:signal transduction histidine kinase/FixJ family two-component response regulator